MYSLDDPQIKKFLVDWFSEDKYQLGQFRNNSASSIDGYINFIKNTFLGGEPAFQSVQPRATIEKLFWEFDCKDEIKDINYDSQGLDYIWIQVLKLCNKIELLNAKPLIVYSGRRGFHVWVYTFMIKANKTSEKKAKMLYKELIYGILDDMNDFPSLDTLPMHVNALARIPFSFHQKTGNQVIPLTKNREPFIPNLKEYKEKIISKEIMGKYACLVNKKLEKQSIPVEITDWEIRPCVREMFLKNMGHHVNLAFVLDAIYTGMSDEEIHGWFKIAHEDYDEYRTHYQIEYQREQIKEGLKPPSKETLKRWGICNECGQCDKFVNPWKQ